MFTFGGKLNHDENMDDETFLRDELDSSVVTTNEMHRYDPETNRMTQVVTTGAVPSPRYSASLAAQNDRVFVHGGKNNAVLQDLYVLQVNTLEWTAITSGGIPGAKYGHSLTLASNSEMIMVGGSTDGDCISRDVKLFDARSLEWKEEDPLPTEFVGDEGGISDHKAISLPHEAGMFVVCFGGYMDAALTHSKSMAVFDISY